MQGDLGPITFERSHRHPVAAIAWLLYALGGALAMAVVVGAIRFGLNRDGLIVGDIAAVFLFAGWRWQRRFARVRLAIHRDGICYGRLAIRFDDVVAFHDQGIQLVIRLRSRSHPVVFAAYYFGDEVLADVARALRACR